MEVCGNYAKSQLIDPNDGIQWQGKLVIKNYSKIKNAVIAINLTKPDTWHSFEGGIVLADNADFINNTRVVHALNYQNFYPVTEKPSDNISYFKYCTFDINSNYLAESDFYKHIDLSNVDGIKLKACTFSLQDGVPGVSSYNQAIFAYNAGFSVQEVCTSPSSPCTDFDPCTFNGFYNGVYASSDGSSINTFSVNKAVFEDNVYGVHVEGVNNFSVLFSDFSIGHNASDETECEGKDLNAAGYGIHASNASGFAIEENHFTKASGPWAVYVGILIAESKATNEIYKNYFDGLSYGNYAEGQNWKPGSTFKGLTYYCNHNTGNYADFIVKQNSLNVGGIQGFIGSTEMTAGNIFSGNATWNFYNDGNYPVAYYYYAPEAGTITPEYPEYVFQVGREEVIGVQNQCLSHYGGGGSGGDTGRSLVLTPEQKQQTEQDFATNLTDYNNVKALFDNLRDGGNTPATLTAVQTAWPADMWQLRSDLLAKSPHLSMDVLKATADKTDVFPDYVIFEIMAANPDELKKYELISYLENKQQPLPGYMIDILKQVATGTTYKSVLLRQMAHYNQLKTRAAHDIIISVLNDSITDYAELRNWLNNIGGKRADEQIIASYMQEGNYSDALTLAEMMPSTYTFNAHELIEHGYYMEMLNLKILLNQEGRDVYDLSAVELDNIISIAENSSGTAGSQAKAILEFAYGYHYCDCLNVSDTSDYKSSSTDYHAFDRVFGPDVEVKPNPANEWAVFDFILPNNESDGTIKILDETGRLIQTFTVSGLHGLKIWDTRKIKQGVYFYTFTVKGISKSGKIVISK